MNWGSVADWVSGLGSMLAGIIALYLARETQRIRLKGFCGIRTLVAVGMPQQDFVMISVTNVGTRTTVVNNVSIRVGFFKKRTGIIIMPKDLISVGIPYSLTDGEEGRWALPLDENKSWIRDLCKQFNIDKRSIWTLRFLVHTNHGETLTIRPEVGFRNEALEVIRTSES